MDDDTIHPATEKLAILRIMQQQPDRPFTVTELAEQLPCATRRVQQILDVLMESGCVARTRTVSGGEMGYITLVKTLERERQDGDNGWEYNIASHSYMKHLGNCTARAWESGPRDWTALVINGRRTIHTTGYISLTEAQAWCEHQAALLTQTDQQLKEREAEA